VAVHWRPSKEGCIVPTAASTAIDTVTTQMGVAAPGGAPTL
jgi:hypothetical protein